ncbi:potassium translocating ATPase, subunit C [Legionella gratiana]|uniref:Potassium-transporting ATPase KdpC subunit n=1 Tax=Legionella gratiana TaxID=45066 RepID=A0A378JE13_9GAMM|nr:potassium-transporting ATPase subunit KdpC [Legionella gratiana]KTD09098.1 potassium translocating ATPase, subunit C [Legionella gratiana]STX45689.1 potassium translocating ATPase, subunit C [Legionella gratiana]
MTEIVKQIKISLLFLLLCSLLTGLIYPVVITLIAQVLFPYQANGSILRYQDKPIGSALIGQYSDTPNYFWGRPSATTPFPYNSANSLGSNMGPLNPEFLAAVKKRAATLRQYENKMPLIPVDLVTASASGLDPEISPLAAFYQIPRIAKARNISEQEIQILVNQLIKKRTLYLLGEPRINVLELNLALDHIRTTHE